MQYEGVLTKMQTEFGNPIQYYLVFFQNVNYCDKTLKLICWIPMFELQKRRKNSVRDFVTIVLFECGSGD
jgi:hypothetical protein